MIKIENVEVLGIARAVYSARNPLNSWHRSDSNLETDTLGVADLELAKRLARSGTDHSKFMRMVTVYCDINAPRYWWTEFDTYKVGTVRNSCSTMHKIHSKEFTLEDFSQEHLMLQAYPVLEAVVTVLNANRTLFLEQKDKDYWWQMIQLLPQSYNQKSTVMLNYQVLRNMYHSRKNHKLDEWKEFCKWIETLPYAELITREVE